MATRKRMWKVAVEAVFCTNGLKDKKLSKYTPRFRAQGDGFALLLYTDSSKSWNLAKRLGWPIKTSSVLSSNIYQHQLTLAFACFFEVVFERNTLVLLPVVFSDVAITFREIFLASLNKSKYDNSIATNNDLKLAFQRITASHDFYHR